MTQELVAQGKTKAEIIAAYIAAGFPPMLARQVVAIELGKIAGDVVDDSGRSIRLDTAFSK